MQLSDYLTEVRTHIEEFPFTGTITSVPSVFWSDQQLVSAINKARMRVAVECWCCRTLQFIPAVQAQSVYTYATVLAAALALPNPPPARAIVHIHNINFQWATSFQPTMRRLPWNQFNAQFRVYPTLQSQSAAWGEYDMTSFYVWPPPPASTYQMEVDATYFPTFLVNANDVDTAIPEILGWSVVPLLACRWAYYYRSDVNAAQYFLGAYMEERDALLDQMPSYSVESWYED